MSSTTNLLTDSTRLPFFREHITAIEWVRGERACTVSHAYTYDPGSDVDRGPGVSTVTFEGMASVCPSFERCINCAVALTEKFESPGKANAALVAGWAEKLGSGRGAMCTFVANENTVCSWSALLQEDVRLNGLVEGTVKTGWLVSNAMILEANLPGFVSIYRALCMESAIDAGDAVDLLRRLASEVPYQMLQSSTEKIVQQVRTLAPIGVGIEILFGAIMANLPGGALGETEALPPLDQSPAERQ